MARGLALRRRSKGPAARAARRPLSRLPRVEHAGLASKRGRLSAVIAHLAKGWSADDAALYLEAVLETWASRSRHQWTLDISLLATRYGVTDADRWGGGPD